MRLERILAPTDFSDGARHAIARAAAIASSHGAALHLVHVLRSDAPKAQRLAIRRDAEVKLGEAAASVQTSSATAHLAVTTELLTGDPFVEIIRCSRERDASLVVVGRHGRGVIQDLFLGTTAERVIRKGEVPVLVVSQDAGRPYRRPLIATDLGDTTSRLVRLGLLVAGPSVKRARLVHAYHVPFEGFVSPTEGARLASDYRRHFRDAAASALAEIVVGLTTADVRLETTLRCGDARSVILGELIRCQADLAVVGTHGRSGLAHVLVGSVAEWVMARAPCDVLVARPSRFRFEAP